jgi:hypothetical protein
MQSKEEIQARITALVKERDAIADRVEKRTDSGGNPGLTPDEELEIFQIEQRIQALRKSL